MALNGTAQAILMNYDGLSTERSVVIPSKTYGSGGANVDMPHAGIPTHVVVSFAGTLSVKNGTAVGTVTANPTWPHGIMGPSTYMDYQGNTRIYAGGRSLYLRDLVIGQGMDPKSPYASEAYGASIYSAAIPAGVANSTVTSPVNFSVTLPIALKSGTALGSYDATVPKGTAQFQLKEAALTGPYVNSPLTTTGSASVSLAGQWTFVYYYLDAPSSVPVPVDALSQFHEFYEQNGDTDQIVAGGTPEQLLLTGREYYRVFTELVANNQFMMMQSTPPIASVSFLVDSSTPTLDQTLQGYLYTTRRKFNRDLPFILYDFMNKPWSPNAYGSLTTKQTLTNSVTAGSYSQLITTRECLFVPSGNLIKAGG